MPSNLEEMILYLERQIWQLPDITPRVVALEQGISQVWTTFGPSAPPPTCTEVTAFPTIMSCIPTVMPFLIAGTTYGFGSVTWNGSSPGDTSGYWSGGCVLHTRLATSGCTQRDIPVFVSLRPDPTNPANTSWTIRLEWINTAGGTCPDTGKTCADFASVTHHQDSTVVVGTLTAGGQLQPFTNNLLVPAVVNGAAALTTSAWFNVGNLSTCPEFWWPSVISCTDATYGNFSATWNAVNWQFCHAGVAYPGHGTCAAVTMALHYVFNPDGTALAFTPSTTACPQATTCASTGGALSQSFAPDATATNCSTHTVAWSGTASGGGANLYLGAHYAITASF